MNAHPTLTEEQKAALRAAGFRPVARFLPREVWAPDTSAPGFAEEYRREAALIAEADRNDPGLDEFLDANWRDLFRE